jgi:hypothetical protein
MNLLAALLLWLSMMVLIVANNAIGETMIAGAGSALMAELYETLVPLPYIALCAWTYGRRTGQRGTISLLGVGLLWAVSTVMADVLLARLALGHSWRLAAVHYSLGEGYWFALVPLAQLAAPLAMARLVPKAMPKSPGADAPPAA